MGLKSPKPPLNAAFTVKADSGLLAAVREIWEGARTQVARSVNTALVKANWLIGRQIY